MEGRELYPLVGGQDASHAKKHHRAGFAQLSSRGFNNVELLHDGAFISGFDQSLEPGFGPIECLFLGAQSGLRGLEDLFEAGTLLRRQPELAPEVLVLPPLEALGDCRAHQKQHNDRDAEKASANSRAFHKLTVSQYDS
jgi:hypothetical protein